MKFSVFIAFEENKHYNITVAEMRKLLTIKEVTDDGRVKEYFYQKL